jgi:hypothetical protein
MSPCRLSQALRLEPATGKRGVPQGDLALGTTDALTTRMETHMKSTDGLSRGPAEGLSRNTKLALLSALVIAAFFILREHWSHAVGLAPYVLLLLCPLMHLFGHRHHHRGHEHDHSAN